MACRAVRLLYKAKESAQGLGWFRHCAANQKVTVSISDGVTGICIDIV